MTKLKLAIITSIILTALNGFSQSKTVTGTVKDDRETLIGVNILIKGTTIGTSTDIDGKYTIETVSANDVLIFSYTGYNEQEIIVGDQNVINVTMQESSEFLEEIVIVGYGTKKKSNVVGAVTSVNIEEATALPTTNVSEMLRGRAAGVQVNLAAAHLTTA